MPTQTFRMGRQAEFDIVSYGRRGLGRPDRLSPAQVAQIARTVRRTPEVMVKVSGGGDSVKAVAAHFSYISRRGELEVETDDGERLLDKGAVSKLIGDWDIDLDALIDHKEVKTKSGIRIYGIPFLPLEELRKELANAPECDILVSHFTYDKFASFPGADLITAEDFKSKFQVAIIGDIHVTQSHALEDGRLIISTGSTELCSASEPIEKFVTKLEFDKGKLVDFAPKVPLPTRKVLTFRIENDADLKDVVEKLHPEKASNPIVFVKFNPDVPDVSKRLKTVLDTDKAILRMGHTERFMAPTGGAPGTMIADKAPVDFLGEFVAVDTPMGACATALLRPEMALDMAQATDTINQYFDGRLAALRA